jgi:catechol 2,3-dioxygenase-like lactoylglutathione lyase family enzyme
MSSVIDHLAVAVADLERSRHFYAQALAPLGFTERGRWSDEAREIAFGGEGSNDFAINGAPGFRREHARDYYGAFALDPDGHNVEAVWHAP